MPAQQRRRRDDEGPPTHARHEPAGHGEQHAVDGGDRRTARFALEDREFVPQNDDFEFLELLRPNEKPYELEKRANQPVAQRHEHGETMSGARLSSFGVQSQKEAVMIATTAQR